ncbi:MAG: hypothetical protein K2Q18_09505, partial [Bdellovibrionales bacterium]|nr:hypothetical protein [Bdellovibrionales bacterium]
MNFLSSNKAIITLFSLGSLVVAGTIKDINSRTVTREHAFSEELAPAERTLASDEEGNTRIALTSVTMSEAYKVDGNWEITRFITADGAVEFDKNNHAEDAKKTIKPVPMKLIGESKVMLNNDVGHVYRISLLSDFGTIAIFKDM